jgi:hypothetical protein
MKIRRIGLSIFLIFTIVLLAFGGIIISANASPNYSTYTDQPNETFGVDSLIANNAVTTNYGTNALIYIGESYSSSVIWRGLIEFDLSPISPTAIISSATLTLKIEGDDSNNARDFNLYRILRDWNEAQVTWNSWKTSNTWTTAGCASNGNDADLTTIWATASLSASESTGTAANFVFTSAGISELQKIINGTYANYGWLIKAATENNDAYSFDSSSSTTSANRPKLVIEWAEPTARSTNTPTETLTPTITETSTETLTPTITETPTETLTPTISETPTETLTPTITYTPTETPTPTITTTPLPPVNWAVGPVTVPSEYLLDAIGNLLHDDPPPDAESIIYAITHISGVDTAWNISIVNLVDVEGPPFIDWNQEDNVVWSWFVECAGADPTWTCDYYELPAEGAAGTMRFPWKTGYSALYGVMGVHSGAAMISGSSAVDFVGGDSLGSNVMPPQIVAVANGTITSICSDGTSMAIRVDGGPVTVAYFHFDTGQSFTEGQTVSQGQVLGQLRYGPFSGLTCGYGVQGGDEYHLHFVFLPSSPGFLEIGGCVLDLSTQAFVCNANTYKPLSYIPNGGAVSNPPCYTCTPTPTPGPGTPTATPPPGDPSTNTTGGGAHIWDGIVDAIVSLGTDTVSQYLPQQDPIVGYMADKVSLIIQAIYSFVLSIYSFAYTGVILTTLFIAIISLEIGLIVIEIAIWLWKNFGWLLKFLV